MTRRVRRFGACAAVVMLAACTGAGAGTSSQMSTSERTGALPPPQVLASMPNAAESEYHVGPLDVLDISVFQVPDLSKTVKVSANGQIALPLIGVVQAGGKTVSDLENEIASKLQASYMQSPQVSVFVREANSQRVTIDGAVKTPGMVALNGQTTLLQTIALSGGLTTSANPRGIVVFRTVDQKKMAAKFDLTAIRAGRAQDPVLYGGDIVVVDSSAFNSALSAVRNSLPVFGLFRAIAIL